MGTALGVSRREALLYYALLMELVGPFGRAIREATGRSSAELYVEIRRRLKERAREVGPDADTVPIDDVDWAAIRILAPIVRQAMPATAFRTQTGFSLDDLAALEERALEQRLRFGHRGNQVTLTIGHCRIQFAAVPLGNNVTLVGVPDEASWDRVMPACARGRREEVLAVLIAHYPKRWRWETRAIQSMAELETWVLARRLEAVEPDD